MQIHSFIHFSHLREATRGFRETNPVLAHSFLSQFPRRLIRVDSCRGWSDPAMPFSSTRRVKHTHEAMKQGFSSSNKVLFYP